MNDKKNLTAATSTLSEEPKKKLTLGDDDLAALSEEELMQVSAGTRANWPGTDGRNTL